MTLLELALKGVRNFTQFTRIPFQPGLNVIYGGNQSGKSTIWQVLRLQLTGQTQNGVEDSDQWGQAALSFRGDDGHTYSLAGYFRDQQQKLGRRDSDGHFERMELDDFITPPWTPVANGDPSLWPLCMGGASWLPSQHPRIAAQHTGLAGLNGDTNLALGTLEPSQTSHDPLDRISAVAAEAAQLETQLAECYSRRTLLTDRMDAAKRIQREMERVMESQSALANAASLSDEEEGALVGYMDDETALRGKVISLDQTIIAAEDDLESFPCTALGRRPMFHFGWLLAALGGGLYYMFGLYPVVIGCLGVGMTLLMGACAKGLGQSATLRGKAAGIKCLKGELKALETPLQERYKGLLTTLDELGFANPRAAFAARRQLHEINARLETLDGAIGKTLDGDSFDDLEKEITTLQRRIQSIQEQHQVLQTAGAEAIDLLENEPASLHPALDVAPDISRAAAGELDISIEPHLHGEPAMREALDRRHDAYCNHASELLRRFTVNQFTELTVHGDYYPTLHGEHDSGHGYHTPGSGMADLIYLAQYVAMVETLDPKGSFPLILDEPFMALDAEHRDLVYSTLQELGRGRQVVLLTCQKFMTSPADHLVML